MNYNEKFYNLYKELEFAIGRKIPKKAESSIMVYMETLPASKAGQLDQMRRFRNDSLGHGVGSQPLVPYDWITFLTNEIDKVDNGGSDMERKLAQAMVKLNARLKSSSRRVSQNRTNQRSVGSTANSASKQRSVGSTANSASKQRPVGSTANSASKQRPVGNATYPSTKQSAPVRRSNTRPSTCSSSSSGQIKEGHRYSDKEHSFSIDLQIKKGQGRITKKAPFSSDKKQMVDFSVYFDYSGKLTDYNAQLLTKTGPKAIKLKRGENKMQIPASEISANTVKVKLSFEYKVGMFTTKKDAMTVGRSV